MSNRNLAILAVIAAVMLAWAVAQTYWARRGPVAETVPGRLIGGLDVDAIASIQIKTEDETIEIKREGTGFVVASRTNYPAMTGQVNNTLASCMDLKPAELMTRNKDNHKDLGVTDETARYVVKLLDKEAKPITGFYLSKRGTDSPNVYARQLDADEVYRLSEDNFPYVSTMNFVKQDMIEVKKEDIDSVTLTGPDGTYTLKKGAGADEAVLENMPAGKKYKGSDHKWVFQALTNLRFENVKPVSDESLKDLKFDHTYVCRLADSTVYTLQIAKKDDKYWMRAAVEFTDKTEVTVQPGVPESEEVLKKKEAKLMAIEKAQRFAQAHKGWVYEIASYKAENLTKKLEALLEDEKKPEATAQAPAGAPNAAATAPAPVADKPVEAPVPPAPAAPAEPNAPAK